MQVDPAQALNVPIVPLGAMLTAAYPFTSQPPYVLSWLNHMITARDMMHPDLLKKLVLNNFCKYKMKVNFMFLYGFYANNQGLNSMQARYLLNSCYSWRLLLESAVYVTEVGHFSTKII